MKTSLFISALLVFIFGAFHFYEAINHFTGVGVALGTLFVLISVLMFEDSVKVMQQA